MVNKKIINATPSTKDGIQFKSMLEVRIYESLKKRGLKPEYESKKFILWERPKGYFTVPYIDRVGKNFKEITSKPLGITYTPDFTFKFKNWLVFLEAKGFKNDVTPYKIRLFRDLIEQMQKDTEEKLCYAVVHSVRELNTLFDILINKE
jgi:hypothetical protein